MITKIEIDGNRRTALRVDAAFSPTFCLREIKLLAEQHARDYQQIAGVLEVVKLNKSGSIAGALKNLSTLKADQLQVHHFSPLKRTFTIGLLTITEED